MKAKTTARVLTLLAALAALVTGCLVEDQIKKAIEDAVGNEYETRVNLELEPLVIEEGDEGLGVEGVTCDETSISEELARANLDLENVEVQGVELRFVEVGYREAEWSPAEVTELVCTLEIEGQAGSAVITETALRGASGGWNSVELSPEAETLLNYYLANRDKEFSYCGYCSTDAAFVHVEYYLRLGVTVKGEFHIPAGNHIS